MEPEHTAPTSHDVLTAVVPPQSRTFCFTLTFHCSLQQMDEFYDILNEEVEQLACEFAGSLPNDFYVLEAHPHEQ